MKLGTYIVTMGFLIAGMGCQKSTTSVETLDPEVVSLLPSTPNLTNSHPTLVKKVADLSANLRSDSPSLEDLVQLTRVYHANGFLQESMACYEQLLTIEPGNPKWKHLFASILSTYGYAEDAILLWNEVVSDDPTYTAAKIRLADAYLKSNRASEAESIYQFVIDAEPSNPYALQGMARVAVTREDWTRARDFLEAAAEGSDGKIGRDLLVTVYEKLGEESLAFAIRGEAKASGSYVDIPDPWLQEMMKACYDPAQLMNQGGVFAFRGEPASGIPWFERALELAPDNPMAHYQIGLLYDRIVNRDQAVYHLQKAAELQPDFSDAWLALSGIYERSGDPQQAELVFSRGFMKCPESPAYNLHYGRKLMEKGQVRQAIPYFNKSILLNPNEAAGYVNLATAHFRLYQHEKGRKQLEEALLVEAGHPFATMTLCFYHIEDGNKQEARHWLDIVDSHPRIDLNTKLELRAAYQKKFG